MGDHADGSATGRTTAGIQAALEQRGATTIVTGDPADALAVVASDASLDCVIVSWDLPGDPKHEELCRLVGDIRRESDVLPVFLGSAAHRVQEIPVEVLRQVDDVVYVHEDTPDFIVGRVIAAVGRYREHLLPPMFKALVEFAHSYKYSWHTPGHTGGTAFLRAAAGRAFFDFFGEPLLRSDLSISVGELGSLLDHSGPIGEAERYAAQVFGADVTFFVTNGSSMSNRVMFTALVSAGDVALIDRNCHKSLKYATTMAGAVPTYLVPARNRYGIIGLIPPERLTAAAVSASIASSPMSREMTTLEPVLAVITNSTYDGLSYDVARVVELLKESVDRIHFDEAWYAYARFNKMYRGRHAMHHGERKPDDPTVFCTQSTHKVLAALSQASMLHIRNGRKPVDYTLFNEAYMMHASTSPQYAIIASNDVTTKMMEGRSGERLTTGCIEEAVAFRQMMARLDVDAQEKGDWFFGVWQPDVVQDEAGVSHHFGDAPPELLIGDQSCWLLRPGQGWHGFEDLEAGWAMLDPSKVTVLTPGMGADGEPTPECIPAPLVSSFLDSQGIVVEKTGDYSMLFLFSMGITGSYLDSGARWSGFVMVGVG